MSQDQRGAQRAEAWLVRLLVGLLSALPVRAASRLGGAVAAFIGPLLPVSRKVGDANLRLAMPDLSASARQLILRQVWRNLGQTMAEFPHLSALRERATGSHQPGYVLQGWNEHVVPYLTPGKPMIFFTAHLANWEIMPIVAGTHGMDFGFIYRAPSNVVVDGELKRLRESGYARPIKMFPKGAKGGRAAYAHLNHGGVLGLLVDQKLDSGLSVPFFGKPAMTMDALASFALKFNCPVLPVHAKREGPARLTVVCEPPVALPRTGDKQADIMALTCEMNRIVEGWIRERPGDWLWLHRRWPRQ